MDQNQTQVTDNNQPTSVDNDLQKAIDDITNNTNIDPVFSDPVAAPSSVPEDDTGELGEPVGPFPEAPQVEMPAAPAPEPLAPIDSMNIPDLTAPAETPMEAPAAEARTTETSAQPETIITEQTTETISEPHSATEVKKAALRDLIPLLDKVNMDSTQKFNIYKDIFDELKDYTVLEPAYQAAREIEDETKRAEALLYLVEAIDKM